MKRIMSIAAALGVVCFLCVSGLQAQRQAAREDQIGTQGRQQAADPEAPNRAVLGPSEAVPQLVVPRLVKFSATAKDELGKPRTGVVGITFAIYKDQEGGAALWMETQNAQLDEQGRYTVLLGATRNEGLPLELFTSGEPRWLGVQVQLPGEVEQPRVLLVSVPYALKAADAETLGGLPASAFALAAPTGIASGAEGASPLAGPQKGTTPKQTATKRAGAATLPAPGPISGSGTPGHVAEFTTDNFTITDSPITEAGGNVGFGTTSPARSLHILSPAPAIRLADTHLPNSFWELQQSAFFFDTFGFLRYENGSAVADKSFVVSSAGNIGFGTTNPQRKLHIRSAAPVIRLEDSTLPNSFWELQQSAFFLDTFGFLRYENGTAVPSKSFVMSSAGNFGIGVTAPAAKLDVAGTGNFTGNTTAFSSAVVSATQGGSSPPPFVPSPTTVPPVAVAGIATATSGVTAGVGGIAFSTSAAGVAGLDFSSVGGVGVYGFSAATSGHGSGILGAVASADGLAGGFTNDGGGNLLAGQTGPMGARVTQFRVDGSGDILILGNFHSATAGNGIILKSPNGAICKLLGIDNTGAETFTTVTCPPAP